MPRIQCKSCQKTLKVDAKYAGKQVKCPCGARIQVPVESNSTPRAAPVQAVPASSAGKITVHCGCGKRLQAPSETAGKMVRCPGCQEVHRVPNVEPFPAAPVQALPVTPTVQPQQAAPVPAAPTPPAPFAPAPTPAAPAQDDWLGDLPTASNVPQSAMQADVYEPSSRSSGGGSGQSSSRSNPTNQYLAQAEADLQREREMQGRMHDDTEEGSFSSGAIGGIAMMVLAAVWFVGGLAAGYIFFYPPVLFIFGLISLVRALLD